MPSTAAEIARTIASGRVRGSLTLSAAGDFGVLHATDRSGRVVIVARRGTELWCQLAAGIDDGAVLTVEDRRRSPTRPGSVDCRLPAGSPG